MMVVERRVGAHCGGRGNQVITFDHSSSDDVRNAGHEPRSLEEGISRDPLLIASRTGTRLCVIRPSRAARVQRDPASSDPSQSSAPGRVCQQRSHRDKRRRGWGLACPILTLKARKRARAKLIIPYLVRCR
ncbi:hypothetical protein BOTBODRAFT_276889 [Botryobasidium botryosum FD-172 SS1]|uniref:Uncharacterized protein n=1 Tax=Botryobasidium botryosum (strain FD-172 SS1) TaxID=930990 RepID=A0A067MMJ8_BOTB1|nr:hypothetical protein BOTBODRAFT_276889 [Botryobasidium botryosum FD-172 SS1]